MFYRFLKAFSAYLASKFVLRAQMTPKKLPKLSMLVSKDDEFYAEFKSARKNSKNAVTKIVWGQKQFELIMKI